jgi:quaternary ammonium compound-resistance protein SugE
MVAAGLSFWLLGLAMKLLPAGTAYPVWVGIGAVGAFIFGIVFFHEPAGLARIACVGLIVLGIVGLKLLSPH